MKQFKTVFKFELAGLIKNKILLVTTGIMMVIAVLFTSIPTLIDFFGSDKEEVETEDTGQFFQIVYVNDDLEMMMRDILGDESYSSEEELKEAVKNEEISDGYIVEAIDQYKYIAYDRSDNSNEQILFEQKLKGFNENYLFNQENIDSKKVYKILNTPLEKKEVILGKDSVSGTSIGFAIIFIMYMLILLYGGNVANSVAREKDSRTMELLITSTKPRTLILGKVAAAGLTGVLQVSVILLSIGISFLLNKNNYPDFLLEMIKGSMTIDTIIVYLLFSILGYILYLFIFASLGSLVSKVEDVSKAIAPISFLFFIAYFAAFFAMTMPNHSITKVTSFIPFISVFTMPIRYMLTSIPFSSLFISSIIMILTVFLFAALSIYIYQFGALNYGNRLTLKEVINSFKQSQSK